jgi:ATP-dependent DNA helicase DinG
LVLELADRPATWRADDQGLLPFRAPPPDGRLRASIATDVPIEHRFDAVLPRCEAEGARWRQTEPIPPDTRVEMSFDDEDRRVLDDVFEVHLPKVFARDKDTAPQYRESQHQVARAIADAFDGRDLLLVHAPTGTGKTIAYLVPALLWARRNGVRVGVATYTRALQEQAMDREVPRVLASLAAAGIGAGFRVSVLKGRENYLCWRSLRNAQPTEEDDGETWLAWTTLALFGLTDPDGDLNRLPRRAPLSSGGSGGSGWSKPSSSGQPFARALQALARQARAEPGCCKHKEDRETCAAEVSRRKAERSHVVITNQAFALLRPEFFKHVVFDECEHLHDQAHSVFSGATSPKQARALLGRLHQPRRDGSRAPLDRLDKALLADTPTKQEVESALVAWNRTTGALDELTRAVESFEGWRTSYARGRQASDEHSLLREYCTTQGSGGPLIDARCRFVAATGELSSAVAALAERLDGTQVPLRGGPRIRRQLELARAELEEVLGVVQRWIPVKDGRAAFPPRAFHDVERNARGDLILSARVLLPNEFLGRHVYPDLGCGVLLSATTWLGQSFDPALRYLGLDRVMKPAEDSDEERERTARKVRTFRAPEVFDYGRVVVATPRDAPSPRLGKDATLDYVRRFLAYLGERTRGRILCLFTNAQDARRVGRELEGFFHARRVPFWYQNMEGTAKEELGELFRGRTDSILLGLDTFWYGADFPGETLEYLVIVKLPYGVPDRYHHAQCAALGTGEQRKRIYMPRALAKLRQGFGRLMRRTSDKGCVFILDPRMLEPRHREFLRELPLDTGFKKEGGQGTGARVVRGDTDRCVHEALAHMEMLADVRRRGLEWSFSELLPSGARRPESPYAGRDEPDDRVREGVASEEAPPEPTAPTERRPLPSERPIERPDVPLEDLPF